MRLQAAPSSPRTTRALAPGGSRRSARLKGVPLSNLAFPLSRTHLPSRSSTESVSNSQFTARAETKDDRVKKRSFGGSCERRRARMSDLHALNPSGSAVPESKPRGRGQFQLNLSVCWVTSFDAGRSPRDSQYPASHTSLDGLSFISLERIERKGMLMNLVHSFPIRTYRSFALRGSVHNFKVAHGLRRGLHSFAASRWLKQRPLIASPCV